ncbi:MAG: hypothetical protein QOH66_1034 [Actinomycetota bacterium]|nr:hypothetical protein [Actinomycetota bacterium]
MIRRMVPRPIYMGTPLCSHGLLVNPGLEVSFESTPENQNLQQNS